MEPMASDCLLAEAFHQVPESNDLFITSNSGTEVDDKWINCYEKLCVFTLNA